MCKTEAREELRASQSEEKSQWPSIRMWRAGSENVLCEPDAVFHLQLLCSVPEGCQHFSTMKSSCHKDGDRWSIFTLKQHGYKYRRKLKPLNWPSEAASPKFWKKNMFYSFTFSFFSSFSFICLNKFHSEISASSLLQRRWKKLFYGAHSIGKLHFKNLIQHLFPETVSLLLCTIQRPDYRKFPQQAFSMALLSSVEGRSFKNRPL